MQHHRKHLDLDCSSVAGSALGGYTVQHYIRTTLINTTKQATELALASSVQNTPHL